MVCLCSLSGHSRNESSSDGRKKLDFGPGAWYTFFVEQTDNALSVCSAGDGAILLLGKCVK